MRSDSYHECPECGELIFEDDLSESSRPDGKSVCESCAEFDTKKVYDLCPECGDSGDCVKCYSSFEPYT